MCRCALFLSVLVSFLPRLQGQDQAASEFRIITLKLPPNVRAGTVQIDYFMTGPFGGYGDFVKTEDRKFSYDIVASSQGKPAVSIKVVAYLPGCKIVTLDIPLARSTSPQALKCEGLKEILMRGHIHPVSTAHQQLRSEVEVNYIATWANRFFGIADGMVTSFHLIRVVPDEHGRFEAAIPDFASQTTLGEGELEFVLRNPTTGNIIAFLRPTNKGRTRLGMSVSTYYPPDTQLSKEAPDQKQRLSEKN